MLKTLVKKQFYECFHMYFVNRKKGKARSKAGIVGMFCLFAVLMQLLAVVFFGMAFLLGDAMIGKGLEWLYFALMGIVAVLMGTFGSVFNTYAALYMSKDNDLLLSMPVPARVILGSRMVLVVGLSFLYSGIVWLPAMIYDWIKGTPTAAQIIIQILLLFMIPLLVSVLTCVLGLLVASIASRLKNKSFLTVIMAVLFFGAYYFLSSKLSEFIEFLVKNMDTLSKGMKDWGNLLYCLGSAASGNILSAVIFCGVTLILFGLCFYVMSISFTRIVTRTTGTSKAVYRHKSMHASSQKHALYMKELKHFTSSPTYMLNCGLGLVLLPILGVMAVIKKDIIQQLFSEFMAFLPNINDFPPLIVLILICILVGMNVISTPSVSLEGENLWIIQSLPVKGADVLEAKLKLHVSLNLVPMLIAGILLSISFGLDIVIALIILVSGMLYTVMTGSVGLIIGVLRPNFTWTSEAMPIKQSLNVVISLVIGILIPILMGIGYYFLNRYLSMNIYLIIWMIVIALADVGMFFWIKTSGGRRFASL